MACGNPGSAPYVRPHSNRATRRVALFFSARLIFLMSLHLKSLSLQSLFLQPLLKAL